MRGIIRKYHMGVRAHLQDVCNEGGQEGGVWALRRWNMPGSVLLDSLGLALGQVPPMLGQRFMCLQLQLHTN